MSSLYIMVLCIIALLGYLITPDKTTYGNRQILELANLMPGTRVLLLKIRKNQLVETDIPWWKLMLFGIERPAYIYKPIQDVYYFREDTLYVISGNRNTGEVTILKYHIADVVFPLDETKPVKRKGDTLIVPLIDGREIITTIHELAEIIENEHLEEFVYWLGSDLYGRDILTRVMLGARISLAVGFIAVLVSLIVGFPLGLVSGYYGGKVDDMVMWLINVTWSIPTLLLIFALILVFGRGPIQIFVAVGLTLWVEVARVVRGQVIQIRELPFVESARALGIPAFRIMWVHIARNVVGPVLVISAANFALAIIIEAGLSYIGIGFHPPVPSWGAMISEFYGYIMTDTPHMVLIPGVVLMITVLAFYQIGNGLRDALEVYNV